MKKHLLILCALFYAGVALQAQVSSISYTFSPTAQYNWWDEDSGIEDGVFIGGQLGFGFGQNVELSAVYLQSFETNSTFPTYGFSNAFVTQDLSRQLNISRYGGNVKLNLSKGVLLPFLSLGTGIQKTELDGIEEFYVSKRIYFDAGLGIKLSVADRYTLNLSAVNHYFEMNPVRELMTLEDREALMVDFNDYESTMLENWGARASLIVYLGGRTPDEMTPLEKAYMEQNSTDYSGFSMPLEPTVGKIKFHERLPYRDTWYVGGATGFNFGPMVGIRAYYWKGMQEKGPDDTISTQTDDIAVYGAEGRFQMAVGQGLKPYILLGGGLIDPLPGYVGRFNVTQLETPFASGGVGINIPFSKAFKFDVYGKAILTSGQENIEDVTQPEDLLTSYAYGASLNLVLGKKKKMPEPKAMPIPANAETNDPAMMLTPDGELVEVPAEETEAGEASEDGQDDAQAQKMELAKKGSSSSSIMIMTPAEFENIIDEILDRSEGRGNSTGTTVVEEEEEMISGDESDDEDKSSKKDEKQDKKDAKAAKKDKEKAEEEAEELRESIDENKESIEELEDLINEGFRDLKKQIREMGKDADDRMDDVEDAIDDAEDDRRDDMKDIKEDLEDVEENLEDVEDGLKENKKTIKEGTKEGKEKKGGLNLFGNKDKSDDDSGMEKVANPVSDEYIAENQRFKSPYATEESFGRRFSYDGMATYVGFNLGGTASLNFGFRPTYKIDSSNLKIAPEAFFGFGSPSSFGIIGNVIRDIKIKQAQKLVNPYVGAGLGFMKIERDEEDKVRGVVNLLAGAHVASVADGRLFVEYATRNFFKYNQFIAGYRLAF